MNTDEAFDTLINQLRQSLAEARRRGTQAFQNGLFSEAQAAAQKGEQIQKHLEALNKLKDAWLPLVSGSAASTKKVKQKSKPDRLPKGEKTADKEFRIPLLATLVELGGSGASKQVLDAIETKVKAHFKPADLELLKDGRTIRWRNTAAWARFQLVKEGLMKSDSPSGIWEISEAGRNYLREKTG